MTRIISIVLLVLSLLVAGYLVYSINDTISSKEFIAKRERDVIKRLELIREAELAYQEVHGNYTSNWDSLIHFIQNGRVPILQRSETIITLAYGADSVIVNVDTIGYIPARERIFKATHTADAPDNGIFRGFYVEEGEEVTQNMRAFSLEARGRRFDHKFRNNGIVSSLADVSPGDSVAGGDNLITYWEYRFNPNVNIDRIAYVPGHDDVKFSIYADEIERNNIKVDVIEVKNPKPFNPARKETNEAINRQPLRFGSRTDVTTSGNWE